MDKRRSVDSYTGAPMRDQTKAYTRGRWLLWNKCQLNHCPECKFV